MCSYVQGSASRSENMPFFLFFPTSRALAVRTFAASLVLSGYAGAVQVPIGSGRSGHWALASSCL